MKLIEKMVDAIRDTDDCGKDLAHQYAQAALTALIEHVGGDGVTEGDREAAAYGYFAWCSGNPVIPGRMKAGQADNHSMVQAFARHRATAFAAGRAARDREIVEWLRELAAEYKRLRLTFQAADCNSIAGAIERGEV